MLLQIDHPFPDFIVHTEALTVIQPGESLTLKIKFIGLANFFIKRLETEAPKVVGIESPNLEIGQELAEGQTFNTEIVFETLEDREGFGDITTKVIYNDPNGEIKTALFSVWISVFIREIAEYSSLPDHLREKLVQVVNYRPRNGHIFLADFVSFFDDFLNIEIPQKIAGLLADEFALDQEGLPVDKEKYISIIRGDITFYGIEKLELIYEEHCNESNDKVDLSGIQEVTNPNV